MKYVPSVVRVFMPLISKSLISAILFPLILSFSSCATPRPVKLDIQGVLANPQAYENEYVALTGYVVDFEPARGDTYRTLYFTLAAGPDEKIAVSAAGYTAEAISKASMLVGHAYEEHKLLTVTGKLKVTEHDQSNELELKLKVVEYGGSRMDVTRGRKTQPGFQFGSGWRIVPSFGIDATITP